jgi:hypothetical protein
MAKGSLALVQQQQLQSDGEEQARIVTEMLPPPWHPPQRPPQLSRSCNSLASGAAAALRVGLRESTRSRARSPGVLGFLKVLVVCLGLADLTNSAQPRAARSVIVESCKKLEKLRISDGSDGSKLSCKWISSEARQPASPLWLRSLPPSCTELGGLGLSDLTNT